MRIELTPDDGQLFRPPLFAQLERFGGTLYHEERDLGHPLGIANHSWAMMETALAKLLDCFEEADVEFNLFPKAAVNSSTCRVLIDAHRDFVYRCVEFGETIIDKVPPSFVPQGAKTKLPGSVREFRRHMDLICNKLKHEQNRFVPLVTTSSSGVVAGYSVCASRKEALSPNPIIHAERRGFSYATDIKRLLADIYCIGAKIGHFIDALPNAPLEVAPDSKSQLRHLEIARRVASLPTRVFPFERPRHMAVWRFEMSSLTIERQGGEVQALKPPFRNYVSYAGDGVVKTFSIF